MIHLLEGDGYRESAASRAFAGWRAAEIHGALNETAMSPETAEVLWRVGRALGEREGTVPEDDHLLRRMERRGRARGRAEGRADMALSILHRRGIAASADRILAAVDEAPVEAVVNAALNADNETDFLSRLG